MKVYVVMTHTESDYWVDRIYSNMTEARSYAQNIANLFYEERNPSNDPEFKILEGTVPTGGFLFGYGRNDSDAEPIVSVMPEELHGSPLVNLAEAAE